eukprot:1588938-Amphidinium_carterae.1
MLHCVGVGWRCQGLLWDHDPDAAPFLWSAAHELEVNKLGIPARTTVQEDTTTGKCNRIS